MSVYFNNIVVPHASSPAGVNTVRSSKTCPDEGVVCCRGLALHGDTPPDSVYGYVYRDIQDIPSTNDDIPGDASSGSISSSIKDETYNYWFDGLGVAECNNDGGVANHIATWAKWSEVIVMAVVYNVMGICQDKTDCE